MDRKRHPSKARKIDRYFLYIVACSAVGVVLGGGASWAESNRCWLAESPSQQCITQDPILTTIQGMSAGLIAGAGAGIGATWNLKRED